MTAYRALFRIRFTNSLQYRLAAVAGLATQFAWGFMYILAFSAFYKENPAAFPMSWEETVSYIWLQQAFLMLFAIWFWDKEVVESVESGSIAYELTRPMDLYNRWAVTIAASRISRTLLRAIPVLAVAFILPARFRLIIDFRVLPIFLFSMVLSLAVVIAFSMFVYISAFYTINSLGIRIVVAVAADFLAGGYIPVPFFPAPFRTIVEYSPFGAMQNMPLLIFNGSLSGADLIRGLALQAFWLVTLVIIGRVLMAQSLRRVVTQGG
jgi:ABC-2 type transport system permease protein